MKIFFLSILGIALFSFSVFADYSYEDIAVLKKYGTIKSGQNSEYSIISIIGHWSDNVGSFGKTECYGKLESEEKKVIIPSIKACFQDNQKHNKNIVLL